MSRVLITGAFGFVGTNLSHHLSELGHTVWALDVASAVAAASAAASPYVRTFTWEDATALPWGEVEIVVHLAGKAHDTRHTSDPQSYFTVNTELTRQVIGYLEAVSAAQRAAFILFSSVKAAADSVAGVLTEETEADPQTPYGQSKLAAERLVTHSSLRGTILRPCMIHGPGNKGNLNLLYNVVKQGLPWPLGAFDNQRSFAAVGNVCAVVARLVMGDVAPGTYQVADDDALGTNELVALIAETLGRRPRLWHVPAGCVRRVARVGDGLRLSLTSERLHKLTESYVVDNAKLKQALGWERMPVGAREGLRLTVASFKK